MEEKKGIPLKNKKGEIVKCECGGVYKWDGTLLLSYPPQYPFRCEKCGDRVNIRAQHLFPEEYPEFQKRKMKLWIARDNAIIPDDMEHFIERHPEKEIIYTKLHIFYDKPEYKNGTWQAARQMCEVQNYMFPQIGIGKCVEFNSKDI